MTLKQCYAYGKKHMPIDLKLAGFIVSVFISNININGSLFYRINYGKQLAIAQIGYIINLLKQNENIIMWTIKKFKTQQLLDNWLNKNESKIQYNIVYINNAYGIQYQKLRQM